MATGFDLKVITRDEWKTRDKTRLDVRFDWFESPFGRCLVGVLEGRVCHLSFGGSPAGDEEGAKRLNEDWPGVERVARRRAGASAVGEAVFGGGPAPGLVVRGTAFQVRVWRALTEVPRGDRVSYSELARRLGMERGARAVARAVARNPVAYLIPCHRVVGKDGRLHGYRWSTKIKERILESELFFKVRIYFQLLPVTVFILFYFIRRV